MNEDRPLHYHPERTTTTEDSRQFEAIKQETVGGVHAVALGLILTAMVVMFIAGFIVRGMM